MTFAQAFTTLALPDHRLMRRVNRWSAPRWVRWWMLRKRPVKTVFTS